MTNMEKKIQELENRIKQLESIVNRGNFLNAKQFDQNVIFKDGITVDNGRILVRSKNNPSGIYLATGAGADNASIVAEQGTLPNGSLYMSNQTFQPFFVKYNGTWTLVNLP